MMRTCVAIVTFFATFAAVAASCGGDDGGSDGPERFEGAGSAAVAQVFAAEDDGGLLPEGIEPRVIRIGIDGDKMFPLPISEEQKDQKVTARFCMEYRYAERDVDVRHVRVYLAQLIDGKWDVRVVKPDGTCEGVA